MPRRTVLKVKEYPNGNIVQFFGRTNNRTKNKELRIMSGERTIEIDLQKQELETYVKTSKIESPVIAIAEQPKPTKTKAVKWPPVDNIGGETKALVDLVVENDKSEKVLSWNWIASAINVQFGNNRTAEACRKKYKAITK